MNRKLLAAVVATAAFALPASAALAGVGDNGYGSQPGYTQSTSNTPCAGHGAFGVYDHAGIPTAFPDPHTRAADGQQTAVNNANLCGNPQGRPAQ